MSESSSTSQLPTLTVHFQGLCAFIRNRERLEDTTEVTAILVAGERADENPRLCVHKPVLVFSAEDFASSTGQVSHETALVPGGVGPRPALGVWPLAGKDLRIIGAPEGELALDPTFKDTADFHLLTGQGAASRSCLDPEPPSNRLVAGRVFLTSGSLATSFVVGSDPDDPDDQWLFDVENAQPTSGVPVPFSQEIRYVFFDDPLAQRVEIEARPIGAKGKAETLILNAGAKIAISNLCPVESVEIVKERDFLAYYALLSQTPSRRLIPHRLLTPSGAFGVRIGKSACPPGTTFLEETAA